MVVRSRTCQERGGAWGSAGEMLTCLLECSLAMKICVSAVDGSAEVLT